jgi:hypothetical protein
LSAVTITALQSIREGEWFSVTVTGELSQALFPQ